MTRYIATGLENGRNRTLTWLDGELTGDDDLQARFRQAWDAADHRAFKERLRQVALNVTARVNPISLTPERRRSLRRIPKAWWHQRLAEDILRSLFAEILDFESADVMTPMELQEWADAWNSHKGATRHHTLEDMQRIHEKDLWNSHHGPPYEWKEIARSLRGRRKPPHDAPEDRPKCMECLQPMEWIWFTSSRKTWEMPCGRAGWTAICRPCRSWRACDVSVMN